MGKIVDGVELLRMIRDGEIKINKTKIIDKTTKEEYIYDDINIRTKYYDNLLNQISDSIFISRNFEILSEADEEIDIENIKETSVDEYGYLQTHLGAFKGRKMDLAFNDRLNELTKAVKQLNKKIKE